MFRQDCTCPALLKDDPLHYPYGAITLWGAPFQALPVVFGSSLAWSAFARHAEFLNQGSLTRLGILTPPT